MQRSLLLVPGPLAAILGLSGAARAGEGGTAGVNPDAYVAGSGSGGSGGFDSPAAAVSAGASAVAATSANGPVAASGSGGTGGFD